MSAQGHSRQRGDVLRMSDLHPASDISRSGRHFARWPGADLSQR
jgi:hypothetical protein